jgi:hypothetical protein
MRCTLVCDGSSDRALIPIVEWSLWQLGVRADLETVRAEFNGVKPRPAGLTERIDKAVELFPCDILFIHRDSEGAPVNSRLSEIAAATADLIEGPPYVCVVPVRMLESWLLLSESAIRSAAGNPMGNTTLSMPRLNQVEGLADPKEVIFGLLRGASGRRGRKLQGFDVEKARTLVSQYITDFTLLRRLPSFQAFEAELQTVLQTHHFDNWI